MKLTSLPALALSISLTIGCGDGSEYEIKSANVAQPTVSSTESTNEEKAQNFLDAIAQAVEQVTYKNFNNDLNEENVAVVLKEAIEKNMASGKRNFFIYDESTSRDGDGDSKRIVKIKVDDGEITLAYTSFASKADGYLGFKIIDEVEEAKQLPLKDLVKEMRRRTFFRKAVYQHTFPEGSILEGYQLLAKRVDHTPGFPELWSLLGTLITGKLVLIPGGDKIAGFKIVLKKV